jgi:hypothetical protein
VEVVVVGAAAKKPSIFVHQCTRFCTVFRLNQDACILIVFAGFCCVIFFGEEKTIKLKWREPKAAGLHRIWIVRLSIALVDVSRVDLFFVVR